MQLGTLYSVHQHAVCNEVGTPSRLSDAVLVGLYTVHCPLFIFDLVTDSTLELASLSRFLFRNRFSHLALLSPPAVGLAGIGTTRTR